MKTIQPLIQSDFYKMSHYKMYPEGMKTLYSNFTPRKSRIPGINHVVVFGIQYWIKEYLIEQWNINFFNKPKEEVIARYSRMMNYTLGVDSITTKHIEDLHDLGYLPLEIKALDEGVLCPIKVPMLTIKNTDDKFAWLVNYLETITSCTLWQSMTSATIAHRYKLIFDHFAMITTGNTDFTQWQGHDFSMRGMSSLETACMSGAGHLLSFTGTDTIPAIEWLENYYGANVTKDLIGASVPASEHSVECMNCQGTMEGEYEHTKRLLELYPNGIVSKVSDTIDLWTVIINVLPRLKNEILSRNGKLVIRPDSGDPVDIICGLEIKEFESLEEAIDEFEGTLSNNQVHGEMSFDCDEKIIVKVNSKHFELSHDVEWNRYDKQYYFIEEYNITSKEIESKPQYKGVIELLWDAFGGTINEKGYKVLDSHIGAIYGDSITMNRGIQICERLIAKGFASINWVAGIGSYSYQCNTRDTFGFAMKATFGIVEENGLIECREIFKDPITDDGTKKSAKGLLCVLKNDFDGELYLIDQCTKEQEESGELKTVFLDGYITNETTLSKVRARLSSYKDKLIL